MCLVLSNGFKGLLLSSYVNIITEPAINSMQELIDKPSIKILHDNSFGWIKPIQLSQSPMLRNRISTNSKANIGMLIYQKEL